MQRYLFKSIQDIGKEGGESVLNRGDFPNNAGKSVNQYTEYINSKLTVEKEKEMKKLLAIVISMAMLVAMMPMGVFAEATTNCAGDA